MNMKIFKYLYLALLVICIMAFSFGCGSGSGDSETTLSEADQEESLDEYNKEQATILESLEQDAERIRESQGIEFNASDSDETVE